MHNIELSWEDMLIEVRADARTRKDSLDKMKDGDNEDWKLMRCLTRENAGLKTGT